MPFQRIFFLFLSMVLFSGPALFAEGLLARAPKIEVNGKPGDVTVQDLSGFLTRPLRLLVNRNNKKFGEGFLAVYALGVRPGDELKADLRTELPGVRVTVYQVLREKKGDPRYLSMPQSVYFEKAGTGEYREKLGPFDSQYLVFVFEKTDSPDEKNIQIRYFEERMRKLVIASYKTNLLLSSLKVKMKDLGGDQASDFFERDAQLLIDRLDRPQRIVILRLWKTGGR